jgi:hypothetical protein
LEERTFTPFCAAVVIFLGPGSMFFHASMKKWGGWVDTFSMILYTAFLLVYDFTGIVNGGKTLFLIVYLVLVAGLGVLTWFVPKSPLRGFSMGALSFGAMAVLWAVLQFFAILGIGGIDRDNGPALLLFIAGLIVFGVAFLIQQRSNGQAMVSARVGRTGARDLAPADRGHDGFCPSTCELRSALASPMRCPSRVE